VAVAVRHFWCVHPEHRSGISLIVQQKMPLFLLPLNTLLAQKSKAEKPEKAERAIKAVINRFFEGMEKGDTALLKSTCTAGMILQSYKADKLGTLEVQTTDFREFVNFLGTPTKNKYEERIEFGHIEVEQSLASVWTPYKFYVNGKISHCGTNSFQLVKTAEGWKIQYIIDTRRKDCK
jgi:Putative lumazine-binding